ncbi:receptor-type tyrosine-protein phosphatase alpha-like isoform X2 [Argopecten irradians]|uniref:receptor-type tyrosine-protein phosphatase alpha-like isoform X2 n=1 Tax=Argopecten irradians TaxID=31199 RepID=UPI00371AE458
MAKGLEVRHTEVGLVLILIFTEVTSEGNLALSKTAAQSSNNNPDIWLASAAVDGCQKTFIQSGCCTHTAGDRRTVWWRVDLGQTSTIDSIQIIYRGGFQQRLAGYELYVSNTTISPQDGFLCYNDTSSTEAAVQLNIIHQCPYVGRYVTVYNYRNSPKRYGWYDNYAILELCEVLVFGCPVGRYGNGDCSQVCPATCYGGYCNPKTGSCLYCTPTTYGTVCDNTCSSDCKDSLCDRYNGSCLDCIPGKHGNFCENTCSSNCQGSTCIKDTGACYGCVAGKYGATCSQGCPMNCDSTGCSQYTGYCQACVIGKHGNTCELDCPANCKDRICDKNNGHCVECVDGKFGDTCNQDCSINCKDMICAKNGGVCSNCIIGKHGVDCNSNCSTNCKGSVCDRNNGSCSDCINGYYTNSCNQSCSESCTNRSCSFSVGHCYACVPTKYGVTCEQDCPSTCRDRLCHKTSGECSNGCENGFYGTTCSTPCGSNCTECLQQGGECQKCQAGLYGLNCSLACGYCTSCDLTSGVCTAQCDPGYEGSYCQTRQAIVDNTPPASTDAGPIVGAIVGVIVVVAIAIVIVILIRRRRLNTAKRDSFDDINHRVADEKKVYDEPFERDNSLAKPTAENVYTNASEVTDEQPEEPSKDSVYVNTEQVNRKSESNNSVYYNSGPVGFPISTLQSLVEKKLQNKAKAFEDEYKSIPSGDLHDHNVGMLPQNKVKNRFKTTFPYDHSRVVLETVGNDPHSDYINANYINSVRTPAEYVATQGPRPGTVKDFWRMIWQLKTSKIVMLTNLVEGGKPKCDKYWPDESETITHGQFDITMDMERSYAFYVIRDITVRDRKTKSERQVHQFHYTTWPDHGTPDPNELVVFHRRVKNYKTMTSGKMVVHCSAGIGRTGTFMALDALLKEGKETGRIDVKGYVNTMREDRVNMVQTAEQYIAIHQLLIEAFDMPDTLISKVKYHTRLTALSNGAPTNQTKLRKEYQLTQSLKPNYTESEYRTALLPTNKMKNKTLTSLAADKFRAFLRSYSTSRSDYINAVTVPSYTSKTGYIVTQTPLEDTVVDLLTMIMDHNCQTLVIIDTGPIDWLPGENEEKTIDDFTLEHKGKSSTIPNVDLLEIAITSRTYEFSETVRVFHMTDWDKDSPVPKDSSALLQLLEVVDSRRKSEDTKTTVVMCRDGYSQSGLFCCISSARDQMKSDEEVDIFQISRQLLVRRPEFLNRFEQYQCCYNVIKDYLETTDVYMN